MLDRLPIRYCGLILILFEQCKCYKTITHLSKKVRRIILNQLKGHSMHYPVSSYD